jgi:hypothetical protein
MYVISYFTNIITKKFETIIKMMGGEIFKGGTWYQ